MTHTLLSAILHITNIEFAPDETTDGVFIVDEYPMQVGELQNMSRFPQSMVNTYSRAQGQVQSITMAFSAFFDISDLAKRAQNHEWIIDLFTCQMDNITTKPKPKQGQVGQYGATCGS